MLCTSCDVLMAGNGLKKKSLVTFKKEKKKSYGYDDHPDTRALLGPILGGRWGGGGGGGQRVRNLREIEHLWLEISSVQDVTQR